MEQSRILPPPMAKKLKPAQPAVLPLGPPFRAPAFLRRIADKFGRYFFSNFNAAATIFGAVKP